jgi:hypothetical protein
MIFSSLNGIGRLYYIIGKEYPLFDEGDAGYRMENNITNTPRSAICGDKLNRGSIVQFFIFFVLIQRNKNQGLQKIRNY